MRAGVTWGNAVLCKTKFPIQQIGRNLQSCLKDPDTYYPFKGNIKTHQFAFAHNRHPFSAEERRVRTS